MSRQVRQDVTIHSEEPVQDNTSGDYSVLDSVAGTGPEPRRREATWETLAELDLQGQPTRQLPCGCMGGVTTCEQHRQARTRPPRYGW